MAPLATAILAGGLATRLRPITETIPKALVDVNGEPFLRHQLRLLRDNGVRDVVVCAGYLGSMIEDELRSHPQPGMHVNVIYDGDRLLGTAGALRAALPLLGDAFFVLYGDSYLPCAFEPVQQAFLESGKLALMTVFHNAGLWDQSNVEFANGHIRVYDKRSQTAAMQHIDYGLGILAREALASVPADTVYDLATLYRELLDRGELAGFEVSERFYEIGSPAGLDETRQYLAGRMPTWSGGRP